MGRLGGYGVVLFVDVGNAEGSAVDELQIGFGCGVKDERGARVDAGGDGAVVVVADACVEGEGLGDRHFILQVDTADEGAAAIVEVKLVWAEIVVALVLAEVVAVLGASGDAIAPEDGFGGLNLGCPTTGRRQNPGWE